MTASAGPSCLLWDLRTLHVSGFMGADLAQEEGYLGVTCSVLWVHVPHFSF